MKKIFTFFALAATVILASCSKDSIGGTAVQDMSGEWYVQVDVVDESGALIAEDIMGGHFIGMTYNVNSDADNLLYVTDNGNFWKFTAQVPCDLKSKTFGEEGKIFPNEYYSSNVKIWNGKITEGGAITPSGSTADAIEFLIAFDDEDDGEYCYIYKIHGWRYTGFTADEDGGASPIHI